MTHSMLENLIVTQLVKTFPTLMDLKTFIIVCNGLHWTEFWVRWIHSMSKSLMQSLLYNVDQNSVSFWSTIQGTTHLIHLDVMTLKSMRWRAGAMKILTVISASCYFMSPNIFHRTPSSSILRATDKVSCPYKPTGKIWVLFDCHMGHEKIKRFCAEG